MKKTLAIILMIIGTLSAGIGVGMVFSDYLTVGFVMIIIGIPLICIWLVPEQKAYDRQKEEESNRLT